MDVSALELELRLPPGLTVTPSMREHCPLRDCLDRIGDRWTVIVLALLRDERRRFGELLRLTPGISRRMLTETLRRLERDGLATRTVHATVPPKVEYELTAQGRSLAGVLTNLLHWSVANDEHVRTSRETYDAE